MLMIVAVKPDTATVMVALIQQVRAVFPFDMPIEQLCDGVCRGCVKKLLEFLDMELDDWQRRLDAGEQPTFGDLEKLVRRSRKIHSALERNQRV